MLTHATAWFVRPFYASSCRHFLATFAGAHEDQRAIVAIELLDFAGQRGRVCFDRAILFEPNER